MVSNKKDNRTGEQIFKDSFVKSIEVTLNPFAGYITCSCNEGFRKFSLKSPEGRALNRIISNKENNADELINFTSLLFQFNI